MITAFTFTASNALATTISSAQKLILRSTSAADTMNGSVVGSVSGTNTSETNALTGKREVRTTATFTTLTTFLLASAAAGTVTVRQLGTKGTAQLIVSTNPANNDTVTIGLVGFTQAYTFKTVLTGAAYEVFIGAAASNTAENLRRALFDGNVTRSDGTGEGSLYGTGTAANPYLEPTAISGQIITIQDLLECSRSLAWSFAQSGTGMSLPSTLSGGVDGTLLATLTAGQTSAFNSFTLDDEPLTGAKLPALFTGTSDWLGVFSKPIFQMRSANLANGVAVTYQWSNDQSNAVTGTTAISNLDNNAQYISPGEVWLAYVRLVVGTNANTTDSSINAKVAA